MIIDTHCHLYAEEFDGDREVMLARAKDNGVEQFLLPNIDKESFGPMQELCLHHPGVCLPMMGIHPCSIKEDYREQLEWAKKELDKGGYIAVGEIGIDLYWDKTFVQEQKEAFKEQIMWAIEKSLPIVIHARDSFNEIYEVMDSISNDSLTGVFHCFTGDLEQAKKALSYPGFFLGIGGVLTFKNSGLAEVLQSIGPERLVLETDAPYLAPVPHRGKRNESAYLSLVNAKLADLFLMTPAEIAEITTRNARQLFKLPEGK